MTNNAPMEFVLVFTLCDKAGNTSVNPIYFASEALARDVGGKLATAHKKYGTPSFEVYQTRI